VPSHVPVTRLTRVASPFAAIPEVAAETGANLVAMGTHGRSGWRRALLGSVAETVVRETIVPVLTVRHASQSAGSFARILCPVNFTAVSRQALEDAWVLATACDAEVLVAHVVEQHVDGGEARFREWCPDSIESRLEYRELQLGSEPAHHILELATAERCDLIVIGANRRRTSDVTVVGTTTESLTRNAEMPVLVVAHREEAAEG
jgi:nucleotide-binding universal stress UspA family protein